MNVSKLYNKSEFNCDAAKVLYDIGNYPPVAHCAYYACYQLLKHIWLYSEGKTEEELATGISNSNVGSHDFLIQEIKNFLRSCHCAEKEERDYNDKILRLKKLRVMSDYNDADFLMTNADHSIQLSNEILKILKKYSQ